MNIAILLVAIVAVYNFGGLVADALVPSGAKQHLFNPRWPPHAKFHNGQTMSMGVISGALSLFILFGIHPSSLPLFLVAAAVAGNYFFAMAAAQLFPGTLWSDPEFSASLPRPLGLYPQQLVSYVLCGLIILAVGLAVHAA